MFKIPLKQVNQILVDLNEDSGVPKNIKLKFQKIMKELESEGDIKIKISKVLEELDEISNDVNLDGHSRSLIWNIVSCLENIK